MSEVCNEQEDGTNAPALRNTLFGLVDEGEGFKFYHIILPNRNESWSYLKDTGSGFC